ncbi:hypothetical protein V1478_004035 [Vespula squamosa]|uniref:Uncharacterized protein n=1 Tax=Vespula squamosa TaxID=30214 RepID=A0ABD2BNI4_VESSQ
MRTKRGKTKEEEEVKEEKEGKVGSEEGKRNGFSLGEAFIPKFGEHPPVVASRIICYLPRESSLTQIAWVVPLRRLSDLIVHGVRPGYSDSPPVASLSEEAAMVRKPRTSIYLWFGVARV